MTEVPLLLERSGAVLSLVLNRPAKRNAIDNPLAEALLAAIESAAADPQVRVLRLCGNGVAFCAGRDVSAPPTPRDLELVQAVARALVACPKPVLVAVQGWCVGAGLEWMLDADLVYVAEDSRFKLPEASLGVFVTGGLVATLPAAIGLARAKALMLTGEAFGAREAQAWGLAWRVVPPADLQAESLAACERLAALQPEVARQFKRVLNEVGLSRFEAAVEEECRVQRLLEGRSGAD